MAGFNLPPGCSVSDIPGNRPEELKEEAFWEDLYSRFTWMDMDHPDEIEQRNIEELVEYVRNISYNEGYSQACVDAEEAEMERLLEKEEKG